MIFLEAVPSSPLLSGRGAGGEVNLRYHQLMQPLSASELRILKSLRTPTKIQDFLDTIPMNFEKHGETCMSPRSVLRERKAHCIEGAMLAAAALRLHGYKPLLVDMKATPKDFDHVIAVFQEGKHWGAISKTNHGVLRYREPIYASIRELVMSYFHEYTTDDGRKTLRSYSRPVNLSIFDHLDWLTDEDDVWHIPIYLDEAKHYPLLKPAQIKNLRKADPIERKIGKATEWAAR